MTTTELRTKVDELTAAREAARAAARNDPRLAEAEELRAECVEAKRAGATGGGLFDRRDALVALIMSPVNAIGVQLTAARRALRAAETDELAASYADVSTEQLTEELANCVRQRRAFKQRQRAVRAALASREALDAARAFLPRLDATQRAALRAELDKS